MKITLAHKSDIREEAVMRLWELMCEPHEGGYLVTCDELGLRAWGTTPEGANRKMMNLIRQNEGN